MANFNITPIANISFDQKRNKAWAQSSDVAAISRACKNFLAEWNEFLSKVLPQVVEQAKRNLASTGAVRTGALVKAIESKIREYAHTNGMWAGIGVDADAWSKVPPRTRKLKKERERIYNIPYKYLHLVEKGFTHLPDGTKVVGRFAIKNAVAQYQVNETLKKIYNKHMGKFVQT